MGLIGSALLAAAAVFNNLIIFVLSLKFGIGGLSTRDRLALAIAVTGILLWVLTRHATFGLLFALGSDFIGLTLTLRKTYRNPDSESALAWGISIIASCFGLLAVQTYTFSQTIYPVYAVSAGILLFLFSAIKKSST